MFTQNPHPFYISLLENEYQILPSENTKTTKWYELTCQNHKVRIGLSGRWRNISLSIPHVYDYFGFKKIHMLPKFNLENVEEETKASVAVDTLKSILAKSLNTENIEVMKLILFEIITLYPSIESILFLEMNENNQDVIMFKDQNKEIYELRSKNIYNLINNFYFITDLEITLHIDIKKIPTHETIKLFENALLVKNKLNLEFNIKKLSKE